MDRSKTIVRTSIIGIGTNVLLAGFKMAVGFISNSIAIVLDAVNNLSDAASSLITIIGTKLANKPADREHPYGHGRAEYLSAVVIAAIILYAGITSLVESVKKIITPEAVDYSTPTLIVVVVAIVVKLLLGNYVKSVGEKVNSDSLVASGNDAKTDSLISLATLIAAIIFLFTKINIEAYLGVVIALVIIKAGYETMQDTISEILGERVDSDISKDIKKTICEFDEVHGAYDLILNNYGPDRYMGSVHIEVPDYLTASELDVLEREITEKVYDKYSVILTGVSVYAVNTSDDEVAKIHQDIRHMVLSEPFVLQMHGFYIDQVKKIIKFDAVIDFAAEDRQAVYGKVCEKIANMYPDYTLNITLDTDFSD